MILIEPLSRRVIQPEKKLIIFIPGPNEGSNFPYEIWKEFQTWREKLLRLRLTKIQRNWLREEQSSLVRASLRLCLSWRMHRIWEEEIRVVPEKDCVLMRKDFKERIKEDGKNWLQSVSEIQKMDNLLTQWEPQDSSKFRPLITKGYELMFKFMINFKYVEHISEEDLSHFLNEETHGQIITAYATWSHFDPITEPFWHHDIKGKLLMERSIHGLPYILNCESRF